MVDCVLLPTDRYVHFFSISILSTETTSPNRCPQCQGRVVIPQAFVGQQVTCPHCKTNFVAVDSLNLRDESAEQSGSRSAPAPPNPPPNPAPHNPARQIPAPLASHSAPAPPTNPVAHNAPSNTAPAPPTGKGASNETERSGKRSKSKKKRGSPVPAPPAPPTSPNQSTAPNPPASPAHQKHAPAPPTGAVPGKRATARLKLKDQAQERNDGELPMLQLSDGKQKKKADLPNIKSNPFIIAALFGGSILASAFLLLADFDSPPSQRRTQAESRTELKYFYEVRPGAEAMPYQKELRAAQQAFSRGDRKAELEHYRNVIKYLRAEDRNPYTGLTGDPDEDKKLEKLLSELLGKRN